jgi:hypothetical protein
LLKSPKYFIAFLSASGVFRFVDFRLFGVGLFKTNCVSHFYFEKRFQVLIADVVCYFGVFD